MRPTSARRAAAVARDDRERTVALNELGDIRLRRNDLPGALAVFEEGLGLARALYEKDRTNAEAARDVVVSLAKIGVVIEDKAYFRMALALATEMKARGQWAASEDELFALLTRFAAP